MEGSQQRDASPGVLTLQEAAERLRVHYMTAYRWIRKGELPAFKAGGRLRVRIGDLEAFLEQRAVDVATPSPRPGKTDWQRHVTRLHTNLLEGRGTSCAALVRKVIADGAATGDVYLHLLTPALHRTGEDWAAGRISVAEEHRATEICRAIVARLSETFRRRGPRQGTVVTVTPPGEEHALASTMLADVLRGAGYEVHHLGANVPIDDLRVFLQVAPSDALCASVTLKGYDPQNLRGLVDTAREGGGIPTFLGGQGVDRKLAEEVGATYVDDLLAMAQHLGAALDSSGEG